LQHQIFSSNKISRRVEEFPWISKTIPFSLVTAALETQTKKAKITTRVYSAMMVDYTRLVEVKLHKNSWTTRVFTEPSCFFCVRHCDMVVTSSSEPEEEI
jgi:hypothetical protein